jgi:hypothetical protein
MWTDFHPTKKGVGESPDQERKENGGGGRVPTTIYCTDFDFEIRSNKSVGLGGHVVRAMLFERNCPPCSDDSRATLFTPVSVMPLVLNIE